MSVAAVRKVKQVKPCKNPGQYSYRKGCKCSECRRINAEKISQARERRFALRELIDGRLVAVTVSADRHGLVSTYNNWGCRCELCSEIQARANYNYHGGLVK